MGKNLMYPKGFMQENHEVGLTFMQACTLHNFDIGNQCNNCRSRLFS